MPRDSSPPHLRWELFSVPWTDRELTIVWGATPKDVQSYNQGAPVVAEVADLLGRSRSAVDLKMANLWSVWRPGHGLPHFSHRDRSVVDRYRGDLERLHADATRFRRELAAERPTVRAEAEAPDDDATRVDLIHTLRSLTHGPGDQDLGIHVYEREGSWWVGFFIEAYHILDANQGLIEAVGAISVAYRPLKGQIERVILRLSDRAGFAAGVTRRILPDLEQHHFTGGELEQIARQLSRYDVDPIHFNRKLSKSFEKVSEADITSKIKVVFHLDRIPECARCRIILCAAAWRATENSVGA